MTKLFMGEKEIDLLISRSSGSLRDNALFHMALATGFRVSDLVNLKVTDVVNAGRVVKSIKIRMVKTGKMVERALPDACQRAVGIYLSLRPDLNPFLFVSQSTNPDYEMGPLNRSSVHRVIKKYLSQIYSKDELRGNSCHVTRRSVAKLISDKAGRIEPASKFLGHVSIANTVAYLDMDAYSRQANDIVGGMSWNQK